MTIAITLLVLEIKVPPPDTALGAELLQLWPSYVAYVVSFLVIGAIWINHHAMFKHIVRVDGMLLLLNVLYLMLIAFLPFPTAVLAEAFHHGIDESIAAAFYGGILSRANRTKSSTLDEGSKSSSKQRHTNDVAGIHWIES